MAAHFPYGPYYGTLLPSNHTESNSKNEFKWHEEIGLNCLDQLSS